MTPSLMPIDEAARLLTLDELQLLDTPADPMLDALVRSAAALIGCPIALVSLVDRDRQWFKSRVGMEVAQTERESAFCAHAILGAELLVVPDAAADPRFASNPMVTGEPRVRFYAGAPLRIDGHAIGTLCVVDRRPRKLDAVQRALVTDLAKAVEHWIVSWRELAQARAAKRASERANLAKSEFLSQISHELRTPLNAVLGFTQLMQADRRLPAHTQSQLGHLRKAGVHLLELVEDLLDLARIEHGGQILRSDPVEVGTVLAASVAMIEPLAAERGVRILPVQGDAGAVAHADERALGQVLLNLLSNGVKYNRENGRLWIEVRNAGAEVAVCVGDEGEGLSAGLRERLFRPFDRLGAESGRVPGSGLGLVISKQLAEAMHGRIEVHDRDEGGCTFEVWLPARPLAVPAMPVAGRAARA